MGAFRRVLLPTDFSSLSMRAAEYARAVVSAFYAELHVVHVVTSGTIVPGAPGAGHVTIGPDPQPDIPALSQTLSEFVQAAFGDRASDIPQSVLLGTAADQIAQYAADHEIDLIVIGTQAGGVLSRMLLGSISESVVERVSCPVLMVPPIELSDNK